MSLNMTTSPVLHNNSISAEARDYLPRVAPAGPWRDAHPLPDHLTHRSNPVSPARSARSVASSQDNEAYIWTAKIHRKATKLMARTPGMTREEEVTLMRAYYQDRRHIAVPEAAPVLPTAPPTVNCYPEVKVVAQPITIERAQPRHLTDEFRFPAFLSG